MSLLSSILRCACPDILLASSCIEHIGGTVAAQGIIYAVMDNSDLLWYRHEGRGDGSFRWTSNEGRKVGSGWNAKHVFSG